MKPHLPSLLSLCFIFVCVSCKDTQSTTQQTKEKDAFEEFARASREMKAAQAKELESKGYLENSSKNMNRMVDASRNLEKASTGETAKAAKVMRIFMETLQNDMLTLSQLQQGFLEATNFSKVSVATDIDALSDKITLYQKANNTLKIKIQSEWEASLLSNLKKEGLSQEFIHTCMTEAKTGFDKNRPYLLTIRKTDNAMCNAVLAQHAILKSNIGKWQWNKAKGIPEFEEDTTLELFNVQALKIQKSAEEQAQAQRKLIGQ